MLSHAAREKVLNDSEAGSLSHVDLRLHEARLSDVSTTPPEIHMAFRAEPIAYHHLGAVQLERRM